MKIMSHTLTQLALSTAKNQSKLLSINDLVNSNSLPLTKYSSDINNFKYFFIFIFIITM